MLLGRVCDKKIIVMIELQGITKSFGTLQVLKGIDLLIEKGEVVSIVGPSGAGKTFSAAVKKACIFAPSPCAIKALSKKIWKRAWTRFWTS